MKQDLYPAFTRFTLGSQGAVTSLQDYSGIPQRAFTTPAPTIVGPCLNDTGGLTHVTSALPVQQRRTAACQ
jgi:hypothetical protein